MTNTAGNNQTFSDGFLIKVNSEYNIRLSDPTNAAYFFDYTVDLINKNPSPAQLISRYWMLIDGNGTEDSFSDDQPGSPNQVIKPGQSYHYRSFCILPTEFGIMKGVYKMEDNEGNTFEIEIPAFRLLKSTGMQ